MKKLKITFWISIITVCISIAQNKTILGDSLFNYRSHMMTIKQFNLKDFYTSKDDFNFRFKNNGQIIELRVNNDSVSGNLTNYIFRIKRNNRETIFNKINLTKKEASEILEVVNNSKILNLPSMDKIEEWTYGCDGITYIFEHSNKKEYSHKKYWTPTSQDSIPESLIVIDLINSINDNLKLKERYKKFKANLPHRGCYNSGSMVTMCYISNSIDIGYTGSTKLPFGFLTALNFPFIGKIKTNFGVQLEKRLDKKENSDINFTLGKSNLFTKKNFLIYNYRYRKLDFVDSKSIFKNHKIYYGKNLKNNLSIGLGLDKLNYKNNSVGGLFYSSKWFKKPRINLSIITSVFTDEIDYKFSTSKTFNINSVPLIKNISIGLNLENFKDYTDLGFNLNLLIF